MLYLIGFMGVGKTTIGEQLAVQHIINFVDTDKVVERISNNSVLDIFKNDGENQFRELETSILRAISGNNIVACGGGLPIYNKNMDFIKNSGVSIYLKASERELFVRLSKNQKERPLIQNKSSRELRVFIKETLEKREPFYAMADYTIETGDLLEGDILRKINSLPIPI